MKTTNSMNKTALFSARTPALALALGLSLSLSAGLARANAQQPQPLLSNGQSVYGTPAEASPTSRQVDLATAGALNIRCGETVVFRSGTQRFAWKFDSISHRPVPLQAIAPAGFALGKALTVYVERNESERG